MTIEQQQKEKASISRTLRKIDKKIFELDMQGSNFEHIAGELFSLFVTELEKFYNSNFTQEHGWKVEYLNAKQQDQLKFIIESCHMVRPYVAMKTEVLHNNRKALIKQLEEFDYDTENTEQTP